MVEGLVSCVPSVALKLNVTPGVLVARELVKWADIPLVRHRQYANAPEESHFNFFDAHALNGWASATKGLVAALEICTQTEGIAETTMLRFQSALSAEDLFCHVNRWCLLCLREWQLHQTRICEPLIWSLGAISVCYEHRVLLEDRCNDCKFQPGVLRSRSAPWSCSQCRKPIAAVEGAVAPSALPADASAVRRAQQIGALLVGTFGRDQFDLSTCLKTNLRLCVDKLANGNINEFKRLCGFSLGTLQKFPDCRPKLDQLLMICERFDLALSSLFDSDLRLSCRASIIIGKPKGRSKQNPLVVRAKEMLRNALEEFPAVSLNEVARRMGLRSVFMLKQSDPGLCALVSARYRTGPRGAGSQYKVDGPSVKRRLESSLVSNVVESVSQIVRELGLKSRYVLERDFADLCILIKKKNDALWQRHWQKMETQLKEILFEEPAPTLRVVCTRVHVGPNVLKEKFPTLASKIVERAREEASALVERRRSKLAGLLPVAHLMTLQDLLKEMNCDQSMLIAHCPEEYREIRKLVRNPRNEAAALRSARLNNIVLEELKRDLENGRETTVASIQAMLPQDALRGPNAVLAALRWARGKVLESGGPGADGGIARAR